MVRGVPTTAAAAGAAGTAERTDAADCDGEAQLLVTFTGYRWGAWVIATVAGSMDPSVHPGGEVSLIVQSLGLAINTSCVPPSAGNVSVVVNGGS